MAAILDPLRKAGFEPLKRPGGRYSPIEVEQVRTAAKQILKRTRHAAEDALDDVTHSIKRYPLHAVGIALGVGSLLGYCVFRSVKR